MSKPHIVRILSLIVLTDILPDIIMVKFRSLFSTSQLTLPYKPAKYSCSCNVDSLSEEKASNPH